MVFEGVVSLNALVVENKVVLVLVDKTQQVFYFHACVAIVLVCLFGGQTWQFHSDGLSLPLDVATTNKLVDCVLVALNIKVVETMTLSVPSHGVNYNLSLDGLNLRRKNLSLFLNRLNWHVRIACLVVLLHHLGVKHVKVQHLMVLHKLNRLVWLSH